MFAMEGQDNNSNVWMNKIIIPMLIEKAPEFHHLKGWDANSNGWKNKIRIPMLIEIGPEYQSLKG